MGTKKRGERRGKKRNEEETYDKDCNEYKECAAHDIPLLPFHFYCLMEILPTT